MRFLVACVALVFLGLASGHAAQTPDDRYADVYSWLEESNQLLAEGQMRLAVEKLEEAQAGLKDLQRNFPNWNTNIVRFRLADIAARLASATGSSVTPAEGSGKGPGAASASANLDPARIEMEQMRKELSRMTAQNARLEARLREALSVQPAAGSPRELEKIVERLKQVEKERDLLAATLDEERSRRGRGPGTGVEPSGSAEVQLKAALAAAKSAELSLRELQLERDALAAKLEQAKQELEKATRELQRRGDRGSLREEQIPDLELEAIRTRRAAWEVMPVSSTPERAPSFSPQWNLLAAAGDPPISRTAPASTNLATNRISIRKKYDLPAGSGALFADVERAVDAGRYGEAEKKLRDILRQDENNVRLLDKLAAVLMDQDKVAEAETMLKKSLSVDPEDPAALYMLGSLKLRQEKTDEALEMLTLSARLEPEMPQTQYFLGRALIQKGDRRAAETALRRAIQLKPSWGEPHYLLAVIYGTEQPVYRELARFHYKKAIAGGATRNLELEKRIDGGAAPAKP